MRKAEAAVLAQEEMEVGLLVKGFFDGPVEAVLQRMAGPGDRPETGDGGGARGGESSACGGRGGRWAGAAAAADAAGGCERAALAEAQATRAERAAGGGGLGCGDVISFTIDYTLNY